MSRRLWGMVLSAAATAAGAQSLPVQPPPIDFRQFAYHEQPGARLPEELEFHDSDERPVRLADLAPGLPLILVPAYFHCPNLCGVVRASLYGALRPLGLTAGRDYGLAVLSVDPSETSADAQLARTRDLAAFGLAGAERNWHYLTGSAQQVDAVAEAIGFRDRVDARTKQILHPAGLVFVTPDGVVSNYLLGVGYTPAQLRSALERARAGRLAAVGAPLLLLCFHFDETTGRYSIEILKVIRLAAVLTLVTVAGLLWALFRRERAA